MVKAKPVNYRRRRAVLLLIGLAFVLIMLIVGLAEHLGYSYNQWQISHDNSKSPAMVGLGKLLIGSKSGQIDYKRSYFGDGWSTESGCDTRNIILHRDLENVKVDSNCFVISGRLIDPYTNTTIEFSRSRDASQIQIDHVVALADAWQTGASKWDQAKRSQFANDPMELLAVSDRANQDKGGADVASWLPQNKDFWCQYIARQISIKLKYKLWVDQAEHNTMRDILRTCPGQKLLSLIFSGNLTVWSNNRAIANLV